MIVAFSIGIYYQTYKLSECLNDLVLCHQHIQEIEKIGISIGALILANTVLLTWAVTNLVYNQKNDVSNLVRIYNIFVPNACLSVIIAIFAINMTRADKIDIDCKLPAKKMRKINKVTVIFTSVLLGIIVLVNITMGLV